MSQVAIIRTFGGFVFDATFAEDHESELEITDCPVETGVVIADHAYMKPLRCTITAGVSDLVLRENVDDQFNSPTGRARRAFELLQDLQKSRELIVVQTGLKLYNNMLIKSIRTGQDVNTPHVLVFTAELREIQIAYTQTVTYPPRREGATKRQAGAKKEKGEQQGKEVTKTVEKKSLAKKLFDLTQ